VGNDDDDDNDEDLYDGDDDNDDAYDNDVDNEEDNHMIMIIHKIKILYYMIIHL